MVRDSIRTLFSSANPVFARAREGRRIPNAVVSVVVLLLLFVVAFAVPAVVVMVATGDSETVDRLMEGLFGLFVPFSLLTALVLLWTRLFERRSPATLGLMWTGTLPGYLKGFGAGVLMVVVSVGTMAIAGNVSVATDSSLPTGYAALGPVLILLAAFVVQGGAEEVALRGWFMQVLGARYRPWIGVLVASVVFTAVHAPTQPLPILNLFLFSLFLAVYCLREGSLWGICGWHTAWNWSMGNMLGLPVSGHEPGDGVLFDLETTGSRLVTGGDFGPEGSLITTIVFLVGIVVVIAGTKPRPATASLPSE